MVVEQLPVTRLDGSVAEAQQSELTFFSEKDECNSLISLLLSSGSSNKDAESNDEVVGNKKCDDAVSRLEEIFDKYQEEPQLLDVELESILLPVMKGIREIVVVWDNAARSANEEESIRFQRCRNPRLDRLFQVVYALCKVRGRKTIVRLLPHAVSDLEPTVRLLQSQDPTDFVTWKTRYSLLLWLSILVRVPFDLNTIDSSKGAVESGKSSKEMVLVQRIIFLAKSYLDDPSACRDAAAVLIGQLLTRPDIDGEELRQFFVWSNVKLRHILQDEEVEGTGDGVSVGREIFLTTGVFHALVEIFKHGHRGNVLQHVSVIFDSVLDVSDVVNNTNTLQRKMVCKLVQRIGLAFLPPRVPKWRYKRGQRSLLANLEVFSQKSAKINSEKLNDNDEMVGDRDEDEEEDEEEEVDQEVEEIIGVLLSGLRDKDTVVRWSAAKGIGRITGRLPSRSLADVVVRSVIELITETETDGAWHGACLALAELARRGLLVPERLVQTTPLIIQALSYDERRGAHSVGSHVRDAACYVCWAFARAYSPEVMRPHMLALSRGMLVTATLDREVNCRRAASAAFQENVGRQGHENFAHGIDILTKADYHSLGLRQNSYLTIAPYIAQYEEYRQSIVDHLVHVKLRHWDKELRQLSAKSLHNIAPLDPSYFVEVVLPTLIPWTLSEEVFVRHGACLAVAEICLALSHPPHRQVEEVLGKDILSKVRNITMKVEKARLFRGKGAYLMRESICRLIYAIAEAGHPLTRRAQLRLIQSIFENLRQPIEKTQILAVQALGAFSREYFTLGGKEDCAEIIPDVVIPLIERIGDENPAVRRGASLGIGSLPHELTAFNSEIAEKCLSALIQCTQPEANVGTRNAEARRDAVRGLVNFCCEVGVGLNGLSKEQIIRAFNCIMKCLEDYCLTDRGDVGSLVRKAAVNGLEKLVVTMLQFQEGKLARKPVRMKTENGEGNLHRWMAEGTRCRVTFADNNSMLFDKDNVTVLKADNNDNDGAGEELFTAEMSEQLLNGILKQACEKIDSVRDAAGTALYRLLYLSNPCSLPGLPHRQELQQIFEKNKCEIMDWAAMAETTPLMKQVMYLKTYRRAVVAGLAVSCGTVNMRTTVEAASTAFIEWTKECNDEEAIQSLFDDLLAIFAQHHGENRVTVPILETIYLLLNDGCCSSLHPPFSFWQSFRDIVRNELNNYGKDVVKMIAVVNAFHSLLAFPEPARSEAVRGLLVFMANSYPKVRRVAAQKLFEAVCAYESLLQNSSTFEDVLNILSTTAWDQNIDNCKPERNKLYPLLLGIEAPKEIAKKKRINKMQLKEKEYGYDDLVRAMHG
eukprot:g5401.t1